VTRSVTPFWRQISNDREREKNCRFCPIFSLSYVFALISENPVEITRVQSEAVVKALQKFLQTLSRFLALKY
jgi:hypothetical protein